MRRISILAIVAVVVVWQGSRIRAWDFTWIVQYGSSIALDAYGARADNTGIYVTGWVQGTLPGSVGISLNDGYLRKYTFNGDIAWTRRVGTPGYDTASGLAVDDTGVFVTGATSGAFPGQTQQGGFDIFVRKYTPDGDAVWTVQFGTSGFEFPHQYSGIALHESGVYAVGLTYGAFPGVPQEPGANFFVSRLDRNGGGVLWTRQYGVRSLNPFGAGGVAVDDTGVYVAGTPETDIFLFPGGDLRKYDFDGNLLWSKPFAAPPRCLYVIFNIAAHAGSVYTIGQGEESYATDCHPWLPGSAIVGLLYRFDTDGNLIWNRVIKGGAKGGAKGFTGGKVVWPTDEGVFVAANVDADAPFAGYISTGSRSDRSACGGEQGWYENSFLQKLDGYVRRYDLDGNVIWTHQFGSAVYELVSALGSNATTLFATGFTRCAVVPTPTSDGSLVDAFLASIAIDPSSPSGRLQLVVGQLETLSDKGRLSQGDFSSLTEQLELALSRLAAADHESARRALVTFVEAVERRRDQGLLTTSEADPMIATTNAVLTQL
jgi:hypothetical protein